MADRTAIVLFKDQRAGLLQETAQQGTRFVYDPDWQHAIACCFPVDRREHEWPGKLHPFFEHLAPEGWLRERQARSAHLADEQDDFGILLRFGSDCIGAVSIGLPPDAEPLPLFNAEAAAPGRTISGVQRKLLVTRGDEGNTYQPAGPEGQAPYIAKFNSERLPDLVRNEFLSLRWSAKVLGPQEVTHFTNDAVSFINAAGEAHQEQALILTRFDRTRDGSKLRLEDFAQILCKPRGQDYAGKYDAAYEQAAEVIQNHSTRPAIDLAHFFRRIVLFAIIGNCDAHLKNFSLLETPAGLRLSPAYDIVNTLLYAHFDRAFGLSIDGTRHQHDTVDHTLLRNLGLAIGLPPRAVDQAFADLARRIAAAAPILTPPEGEPPDGFVHRYSEIVTNACLRILPQ